MTSYAIAAYLTPEERARAVAATYTPRGNGRCLLRTAEGDCPLGVALATAHRPPSAADVAWELVSPLLRHRHPATALEAIEGAAAVLIEDWDAGRLRPSGLAVALGVADGSV